MEICNVRRALILSAPLLFACSAIQTAATLSTPIVESTATVAFPPAGPSAPPSPTLAPTEPAPPTGFPDAAAFTWSRISGDLQSPVDIQHAGDGRLFIVEQHGVVRILDETGLLNEPFLDIHDRVLDSGNEQGLLGLAFHPDFAANGAFYVNYTRGTGDTVIARFGVSDDPNRADPDSESVLLEIDQPFANHNGGGMAFGPDGYLYIGTGDGGSQGDPEGRAQNPDSLLGKILRLDVDAAEPYAIPPENPFAAGGGRPEIWALGLRNPWRFAFDPATGDLFIGDVGQNQWEEIDVLSAGSPGGANFGWDLREGLASYEGDSSPAFTDPVAAYSHDEGGCSVTGGEVVRDPALPEWQGIYIYGDYCSGLIWGLFRESSGAWQTRLLFDSGFRITSFGSDIDGAVYLLDRLGGVYRLIRAE
jgi:glucose/arabinose dehydrogenase